MLTKFMYFKIAIVSFLLVACSVDAPTSIDETESEGHGQWYKVTFRFTEGELKDTYFQGFSTPNDVLFKIVQNYNFVYTNKGVISSNSEPIRLVKGKSYGLEIFYHSKDGKVMNHEFTTASMSPLHQHFFIPHNIKTNKENVELATKSNIINYIYRDTNPDDKILGDKGVSLRDVNDPIGLKGYFTVNKAYQSFDLRVILVHVIQGDKLTDERKPYPFYNPSQRITGTTDLNLKIPIKIFSAIDSPNYKEEISEELGIPMKFIPEELAKRKLGKLKI